MMLGLEIFGPETSRKALVDHAFILSSGKITKQAENWFGGKLKPIRTEADYDAALAEVERLWGANSGTPEGDRLDVLATLIEVYEVKHHPMDPPDPIEAIKFRMEPQ